ncbi:MAG: nuclear transport factor 2 family protein [Chloroflexota bacterium]
MAGDPIPMLKDTYAAFGRGDIPAIVAVMNPAIEWHEPGLRGFPPPGGDRIYLGPKSVVTNIFTALAAAWDDVQVQPEEYLGTGERVAVVGRFRGTAKESGRALDVPFVHVWTVRDGTLCRFEDYTDTAKVLHALGAIAAS